jgi:speckle-type POZ protein
MSLSTNSFEFTWKIPEFSYDKLTSGKAISSPVYAVRCGQESGMNCVLQLRANTESKSESNENWVSVFILIDSTGKSEYCYHIESGFLDSSGEKVNKAFGHMHLPTGEFVGKPTQIRQSTLEKGAINLLPGDTLTVYCRIEERKTVLNAKYATCDCPKETTRIIQNRRGLISDLNNLMNDKTSCDLQITVKKQKIDAHQSILTARSPVFAAMLKCDMNGKRTNSITISDIDAPVFAEMLRFMYTGFCNLENWVEELYAAAYKYDIRDLKEMCEENMLNNLNVDNAFRLLLLSDARKSRNLKENTIAFINRNAAALVNKPCWNDLMKTYPHLMTDIYMKGMGIKKEAAK